MLQDIIKSALNILWPLYCQACKEKLNLDSKVHLCEDCFAKIKFNKLPFCKKCGRSLEANNSYSDYCRNCQKNEFNFERSYSACLYEGILKELLHEFKYNKNMQAGNILSAILLKFFEENFPEEKFDFIVPIPLFAAKEREREFNQAEILARPISKKFLITLSKGVLVKLRPTPSQTTLTKEKRFLSQKGVFKVRRPEVFYKKKLLVIDDIMTTGATMNEAAFTLKKNGASEVYGLTLIRG